MTQTRTTPARHKPRRKVSRQDKRRILRRRRAGLCAALVAVVLLSVFWQTNHPVSAAQLDAYGWRQTLSVWERGDLNRLLRKYDITDPASLTMFFATVGAETDNGRLTLEQGGADYYASHGYSVADRGAGYIQLTHRSDQLAFLRAMGDPFDGADTAGYIAQTYPWESACWVWSVGKTSPSPNPNAYAAEQGNTLEVFLATQYGINGWRIDDDALGQIVRGAAYTISPDGASIQVAGTAYPLPVNWADRAAHYEQAKQIWG